jgi:MFS family permease
VGGDVRKVGYYTGIIVRIPSMFSRGETYQIVSQVTLHCATVAVTVLFWSRLSDHIGRKPVILFCLAGTAVSIVLFGFSRTFWTIIVRCGLSPPTQAFEGTIR